ncbi:hypothetical protein [Streptomyces prasinus]
MTTAPTSVGDFADHLRSRTADTFTTAQILGHVRSRCPVPDTTHVAGHKQRDRAAAPGNLSRWRADRAPYEPWIHGAVLDGISAAARCTVGKPLVTQVRHSTEALAFGGLADDGRVRLLSAP